MSGGMDIDWSVREKILSNARSKFGDWTKEQIIAYSEKHFEKIKELKEREKAYAKARRLLEDEQDEIYAILKEHK